MNGGTNLSGRFFELPVEVDVYRNLTEDCLSVIVREGEYEDIVTNYEGQILLRDVTFVIDEDKRAKSIESGDKNIHAYARGVWDDSISLPDEDPHDIKYEPFEKPFFITCDNETPIESAEIVKIDLESFCAWGVEEM